MAHSPRFVAHLPAEGARRTLRAALLGRVPPPPRDHVAFLPDRSALLTRVCDTLPAVAVFEVDGSDGAAASTRRWIGELRRALPRGGLLAWLSGPSSSAEGWGAELPSLGVDRVFRPTGRRTDTRRLREMIDGAWAAAITLRVFDGLDGMLPADLRTLMEALLAHTVRPATVGEAAALAFTTERTLRRHLANAGFPTPRTLIGWCRLFHAASLLENPRRSVLNVTIRLDFASPNALRNRLRRHADATPTDVRRHGLPLLLEAFVRRHEERRWGVEGW